MSLVCASLDTNKMRALFLTDCLVICHQEEPHETIVAPLTIHRPRHGLHPSRLRPGADQARRGGAPHSGPALGGQSTLLGSQVAAEEINAAGGLLDGRKIEIVTADTRGIAAESERAYRKLVTQDEVVGVVCCWYSASTIATLPTIEELKIPTTTGVAYLPDAKETKLAYLFTPRLEARFVDYWVNKLNIKKVAFLALRQYLSLSRGHQASRLH